MNAANDAIPPSTLEPTPAEELAHAIHNQTNCLPVDLAEAYRRNVRALLNAVAPGNAVAELI